MSNGYSRKKERDMGRYRFLRLVPVTLAAVLLLVVFQGGPSQALAAATTSSYGYQHQGEVTPADRQAAADSAKLAQQAAGVTAIAAATANPGGMPDYFGTTPNYANSSLPKGPVASITLMDGGSGYSATPTVTITDAYGSAGATGATATATVVNGEITLITLGAGGSGYVAPVVTITDATGEGAMATAAIGGAVTGGIRKFVDTLPLPGTTLNDLGQALPIAVADTTTYPGGGSTPAADYYWIGLIQFKVQLHKDLPATTIRGYVQLTLTPTAWPLAPLSYNGGAIYAVAKPQYLGPIIIAQKDRPVRVKFTNFLSTTAGGDLFLPVDSTLMGAGAGPNGGSYSTNRATLHLHGGVTPWISDGTMHQWTTPYGTSETYPRGVSVRFVPDMWFNAAGTPVAAGTAGATNDPGPGSLTFYYTNQQSARLMFYHDHAYGITRLNVYAGEAAGYLLQDPVEQGLVANGTIPGKNAGEEIPLIIQDKTFVDVTTTPVQDPTWNSGTNKGSFVTGDLWFPHVYMPNQNPADISGTNAMGRWDYGPWFWPPFTGLTNGPVANPLAGTTPQEGPVNPGTPNPSVVPEAFMDTPLVNGTAYPTLTVQPKAYRFHILNASNDRTWNLQLYTADPSVTAAGGLTEVKMVPAIPGVGLPARWPTDGRDGGVPDPKTVGPSMIQIGTEGGLLPAPAVLLNTPIGYIYNRRDVTVLNVSNKTLFLGPAERADVVVDFSQYAGKTLILYNDGPAPVPAFDPRYDYYTGDPDQTSTGGAPTTVAGYGPNTRTVMQIVVQGTPAPAYNLANLQTALPAAYAASQPPPVVGQTAYNKAFNTTYPADPYVRIQDTQTTFTSDMVGSLTVTSGGSYTSVPTVIFSAPQAAGGTLAAATANLGPATLLGLVLTNGGSGYTSAPAVSITGGGGSGATGITTLAATGSIKSVTITNSGLGYRSAPTVSFNGTGGSGAAATATISGGKVISVKVTSAGTNYPSNTTVSFIGGSPTSAATGSAVIGRAVASVTLTNAGSGYTSAPTVTISGGGFGSSGSGATATATLSARAVVSLTLTNPGSGYLTAPTVSFSSGTATATAALAKLTVGLQPKAIQELFNPNYGQMNATLGVEIPNTTGLNQTTIPYYMVDPPTEVVNTATGLTPPGQLIQSLPDGTQIWKITHNGVDTHAIHWHMFNVQVINRVGWDGMVKPPDANELGWKDTVRMNPLEDVIVAIKPIVPTLPWQLPNSIRALDVTMPLGMSMPNEFLNIDPTGQPATVTNSLVNFGWEYVWHCHLLGHEENDMMRSMAFGVAPLAPKIGAATKSGTTAVIVSFTDTSVNETGFTIQRATAAIGPWTTIGTVNRAAPTMNPNGSVNDAGLTTGSTVTFTDPAPVRPGTNYYRVITNDMIGYTQTYAAPAVGYPHVSVDSKPSTVSNGVTF
jgi:FtsP/CotA-like multicopper oxidase with cupredoxin domain